MRWHNFALALYLALFASSTLYIPQVHGELTPTPAVAACQLCGQTNNCLQAFYGEPGQYCGIRLNEDALQEACCCPVDKPCQDDTLRCQCGATSRRGGGGGISTVGWVVIMVLATLIGPAIGLIKKKMDQGSQAKSAGAAGKAGATTRKRPVKTKRSGGGGGGGDFGGGFGASGDAGDACERGDMCVSNESVDVGWGSCGGGDFGGGDSGGSGGSGADYGGGYDSGGCDSGGYGGGCDSGGGGDCGGGGGSGGCGD